MDLAAILPAAQRFHPPDLETAKAIILTGDAGSTEERWALETPWLQSLINTHFPPQGTFLDYGCGIGRVGRELGPPRTWINVDSSPRMLRLGQEYWGALDAGWVTPHTFRQLGVPSTVDGAVSIYVLQHIPELHKALEHIHFALKPGAPFLVLNSVQRWLPTDTHEAWSDDGVNVHTAIEGAGFVCDKRFPRAAVPIIPEGHFCNLYVKV